MQVCAWKKISKMKIQQPFFILERKAHLISWSYGLANYTRKGHTIKTNTRKLSNSGDVYIACVD